MSDYIGKYVKKFESGSKGSSALAQCGQDWGLSCGSYQLTLRFGNCINFLKKYFPNEKSVKKLYFNVIKDFASKTWPGAEYCSSPDEVSAAWTACLDKVGEDKFFSYEHEHIKNTYYDKIRVKIKDILDLNALNDRAYKECFWSWPVHKGVNGCYNAFMDVLKENNLTALDNVDKEVLFDLIYDKRYEINKLNRYKKGIVASSSERETLRPLLTKGTIGGVTEEVKEEVPAPVPEVKEEPKKPEPTPVVKPVEEKVEEKKDSKVPYLLMINKGTAVYATPNSKTPSSYILSTTKYTIVEEKDGYGRLKSGVGWIKLDSDNSGVPYYVKIKSREPVYASASKQMIKTYTNPSTLTIVEEKDGFGKLKSGLGWINLSSKNVVKM